MERDTVRVDLDGDERVLVRTRQHPRRLAGAAWMFLFLMAVTGFVQGLLTRIPELGASWSRVAGYLVPVAWVLLGIAAIAWVLRPVASWLRTRYVITSRRVLSYQGRHRRELPLAFLTSVEARGRSKGAEDQPGTLLLYTARGEARLKHVPSVRRAASVIRQARERLPWDVLAQSAGFGAPGGAPGGAVGGAEGRPGDRAASGTRNETSWRRT